MSRIPIAGVRISTPLAQITLCNEAALRPYLPAYLRSLSDHQINLALLAITLGPSRERPGGLALCVACEEAQVAHDLALRLPDLGRAMTVLSPVSIIQVFPHRHQLSLLSHLLGWLRDETIPILGLASSIAAVGLVLPDSSLDDALSMLDRHLALPANHAPLRSPLHVVKMDREETP